MWQRLWWTLCYMEWLIVLYALTFTLELTVKLLYVSG
ncbi:hypothetical protein ECH_0145 [Ehrlichia chaffeensis str. Arkansas]|uniref:Uncharacterized protein n=1 Tax=Ehrlichia chaffeensis (strain ATCC CRL-10679 / Arkansas) TaxID=205920 RepID=Q2GHW0_EHRCR|nr:hypothetical protein ECH_0145 [Ehrlichia chaffeensis str. Arkansas]